MWSYVLTFYESLDFFCWYFIQDFCNYVHDTELLIFFFPCKFSGRFED